MAKIRKAEIKKYVEDQIKIPGTDAVGLTDFEKTFTKEEWDYYMDLLRDVSERYARGEIDIPEPLVG